MGTAKPHGDAERQRPHRLLLDDPDPAVGPELDRDPAARSAVCPRRIAALILANPRIEFLRLNLSFEVSHARKPSSSRCGKGSRPFSSSPSAWPTCARAASTSWCPRCTGASASRSLLSIGAAVLFQRASNQALWEGVLALTAAVLVASLIVHMWRHAKRLKREIEAQPRGVGRAGRRQGRCSACSCSRC